MSPVPARGNVPPRCATRLASAFAIASFLAVSTGCIVARAAGVGPGVWTRNAAAWAAGALLTGLIARIRPALLFRAVLVLTPFGLLMSLFSSGQSGVHRWVALGPLSWNVAFLCLPAATVAFAAKARSGPRWTVWAALVTELELCLEADASQATAFAAAVAVTLLRPQSPGQRRPAASLVFLLAAAFAWTRPDPLAPVPEVEGIIKLAAARSGGMAALAIASLAAVTASPLFARIHSRADAHPSATALCVYFLICSLMPLFGAFPVPLVGMGMSPIIGFWGGIGALMTVSDSTAT